MPFETIIVENTHYDFFRFVHVFAVNAMNPNIGILIVCVVFIHFIFIVCGIIPYQSNAHYFVEVVVHFQNEKDGFCGVFRVNVRNGIYTFYGGAFIRHLFFKIMLIFVPCLIVESGGGNVF
jgi:hypothetical protein